MNVQTQQEITTPRAARTRVTLPTPEHRHAWRTESSHRTADGVVRYVHCHGCGARRVELQPIVSAPAPISREFGAGSDQRGAVGVRSA